MPARTTPAPERFTGFPDPTARFFRALAKNQRREWFQMHRDTYDSQWVQPMTRLLDEVHERIDPLFVRHPLGAPKIFRIYRDVRFSADKSPYKTHIGGYIPLEGAGTGPNRPTPLYVHFGAGETIAAAGHYLMDAQQLARYRAAVLDDRRGKALAKIVATATKARCELIARDALKKVPRGIDPEHPRADLLKLKSLGVHFPAIPKSLIGSPRLVTWLVTRVRSAVPLVEWLADATD